MKLTEIKALKQETVYKRVLDELRLKGLHNIYISPAEGVNYLDIVVNIVDFLDQNKKLLKKIKPEQYENIVVICVDEMLEGISVDVDEEQIEKILRLLKNSLLIEKLSKYLFKKIKKLFNYCKIKFSCVKL